MSCLQRRDYILSLFFPSKGIFSKGALSITAAAAASAGIKLTGAFMFAALADSGKREATNSGAKSVLCVSEREEKKKSVVREPEVA